MKRHVFRFILCGLLCTLWLSPQAKPPENRDYTAHLVGHAHIDLSWLWIWEETVHDVAFNTFRGTLAQMDKMPLLTFAQSQAAIYDAMEKSYPDIFKIIGSKVREGIFIPVGGMWVEPDLNMPDGESLARQLLYGKNYFREKFGSDVAVGWNPDAFGHNGQLPQILAKAGIRYYVFERCAPEKNPFFWWQGIDKSKVLSYVPPGWYLVDLKPGLRELLTEAGKNTDARDFMILYGEGDHGGGPRDTDLQAIEAYSVDPAHPRMEFAVPETFFRKVEGSGLAFPTVDRELNFIFPACYTTQAETKKNNRLGENLLLAAETFSSWAAFSRFRDYYPERDLDEAWKIVLRNQFHDILDGSSIGPVYDEVRKDYLEAFRRGERALDFSLESIANGIDTMGEGIPVVVFNPLFWQRSDPVEIEVSIPKGSFPSIRDSRGREITFQVLQKTIEGDQARHRLLFLAREVPSFGYSLYRIMANRRESKFPSALRVSRNLLENDYFRIEFSSGTGWIRSIFDKSSHREVLAADGNILQAIADEPETMSAWELGLKGTIESIGEHGAQLEVIEKGPVRAVLRIRNAFRRSRFQQDIILHAGFPRIDCRLKLDWQERNVMIKAAFPVVAQNRSADFEIPFGFVSRPVDGAEVPALKWIDLSDESGKFGVSLLNDCKYGFDVRENTMRISVVHGATQPDPEADRGSHELLYSLYPHAGTWRDAGTVRRGYELNRPLIPHVAMLHGGTLPPVHSFIGAEPENAVVSTLKKETGYFNRRLVLRLYETFGRNTVASITFPWPVEAVETDLIERPLREIKTSENRVSIPLEPFEIKTLRIARKEKP